jgi:hypothetical protein
VSSAYIEGVQNFKDLGISFIYSRNSDGPKIEPCGIPQTVFLGDEIWPLTVHCCSLLIRYRFKPFQFSADYAKLNGHAFFVVVFHDLLSQTLFERQEILHAQFKFPLSMFCNHSSHICISADNVECLGRNPD